jgi:hypothetical protein
MQHEKPKSSPPLDQLSVFTSGAAVGGIIVAGFMSPSPLWLHLARPPIILCCAYTPVLARYLFRRYRGGHKLITESAAYPAAAVDGLASRR